MNDSLPDIAEAFSRKALVYDDFGVGHENLAYMRQKVRQQVLSCLQPGDRILELNAGTGADAVFFARRGFSVHAIDISAGMLDQIRDKIARYDLSGNLSLQQCSFSRLEEVQAGLFQCVISNMGGVNCSSDLEGITRGLAGLLSPGAWVIWVVMPPVCLWELSKVLKGDLRIATRRLSPRGNLANVEGVRFMTYYYPPRRVMRAFGESFHPVKLQGLSVFTPPADHKDFSSRHPRLYGFLRSIDERMSDLAPFNRWGDFYILTLRYRPIPHED